MTAYFANVFFGVRQAIELDSLRWAIEQCSSGNDRDWALGALVATASAVATTYGGHFAQPIVHPGRALSGRTLHRILENRAVSVIHDFSVRLSRLCASSPAHAHQIKTIPGPWDDAISSVDQETDGRRVAVYVDAPYKREEYSRYYHVLETLVSYSYPASIGIGRMPDKGAGQRFQSRFFSRSRSSVEKEFVRLIESILSRGWACLWSYSDSGAASIVDVSTTVARNTGCRIRSSFTTHSHHAQRGHSPKTVTEFLIEFSPRAWQLEL